MEASVKSLFLTESHQYILSYKYWQDNKNKNKEQKTKTKAKKKKKKRKKEKAVHSTQLHTKSHPN